MSRRSRPATKAAPPTSTHLRIATYTRRSTDEDNQPFSIEAQNTRLDAYVASQDGWSVVAKFTDDASGASLDRPGLQRALTAAHTGVFDVLLVYRLDRFSRRNRDLLWLLDELEQTGVAFRSATEPFETTTPAGRMAMQMLGVFAEFEREMIIDRVVAGMERKASRGQWTVGFAPEGYQVDPTTHHLQPQPSETATITEIFDLYTVRRQGTRTIATTLNRRGLRRRSGRPWNHKTITDVLTNPAYIGAVAFRDIYTTDAHPPIITTDTFEQAQQILTERGEHPARSAGVSSNYHLTGKIRCPRCGQGYLGTAATGKRQRYRYYTCFTRNRYGTMHCDAPRIRADALEEAVLQAMGEFYRDHTTTIMDAVADSHDRHHRTLQAARTSLATVATQLAQKQLIVDRYFTDYEAGTIDRTLLETRIEKLSGELTQLRRRRDTLQLRLDTAPHEITTEQVSTLGRYINQIIDYGSDTERKHLCELLIDNITLDPAMTVASPTWRIDPNAPTVLQARNTPAGDPAGVQKPSLLGVRERQLLVETRGLEPLTPALQRRCSAS